MGTFPTWDDLGGSWDDQGDRTWDDQDVTGVTGFDTFAFGSGGQIIQDQIVTGIAGVSLFVFGAGGTVAYDLQIIGLAGSDLFAFGSGGEIIPEPIDYVGLVGINLFVFGSDGSVSTDYTIRGSRGIPSRFRFGIGGSVEVEYPTFQKFLAPWTVDDSDVYFRRGQVARNTARFFPAQMIELGNGDPSQVAPWRMVRIDPQPDDKIITVGMGEQGRLDIISFAMYGSGEYWHFIACANDIINPFEEPLAGDRIRIPSFSRILELLGVESSGDEVSRYRNVAPLNKALTRSPARLSAPPLRSV